MVIFHCIEVRFGLLLFCFAWGRAVVVGGGGGERNTQTHKEEEEQGISVNDTVVSSLNS